MAANNRKNKKTGNTKSITEMAGCRSCHYCNNETGNCWLYGVSLKDINDNNPGFNSRTQGYFKIFQKSGNDIIIGCRSFEDAKEIQKERKKEVKRKQDALVRVTTYDNPKTLAVFKEHQIPKISRDLTEMHLAHSHTPGGGVLKMSETAIKTYFGRTPAEMAKAEIK